MSVIYEGINGAVEAKDVSQLSRFKIAIVGKPKVGKSHFASTFPGKKYIFDFDARKESLAGKPDLVIKTYKDPDISMPKAIDELEADVAMFEYLAKQNKTLPPDKQKPIPDCFILDSVTHWVKVAEAALMKSCSDLKREIKFGTKAIKVPTGWDVSTGIRNHTENIVCRLNELGHVICVFHEEPEKDKINSTVKEPKFTGQYAVHPYYLRTLLSTFNEVWRLELKGSTREVTTKASYSFGASTTLLIDGTEAPDIAAMIKKHEMNLAKQQNQNQIQSVVTK